MLHGMIQHVVKLQPSDVKHFVHEAEQCDFDIDISYNRVVVDAKSILGVFGLDLSQPLTIRYYGYNSEFENYVRNLAIAC